MVERLRGRPGQRQRERRLRRTHGLCEDCLAKGRTEVAAVVDHIIPLALGGSDDDANTRNLCKHHADIRTAEQFGHRVKVKSGAFEGLKGRVERCKAGYALVIFTDWNRPVKMPASLLREDEANIAANVAKAA